MSQVITTNHTYKNEKLFILIETIMPDHCGARSTTSSRYTNIYIENPEKDKKKLCDIH